MICASLDPAVLRVELAAKRQVKIGQFGQFGQFGLAIGAIHARFIRGKCAEFCVKTANIVHFF